MDFSFISSISKETWISIFTAIVTTAAAVVTYAVYRSSTDPFVIVFAKVDLKRPSLINLTIKNIGKGPAYDVSFLFSQSIPGFSAGIETASEDFEVMSSGPLIRGMPFLAPDQELTITWGQYGGLLASTYGNTILVDAFYYRSRKNIFSKRLSAGSNLDIKMFEQTESSEYGYGPEIAEHLKILNRKIDAAQGFAQSFLRSRKS